MPRLRIAATVTALVALAVAPAAAHAAVTSTQITSWTTQNPTTSDNPYLLSVDNPPNATTVTVIGDAPGPTRRRGRRGLLLRRRPRGREARHGPIAIDGKQQFTTGAVPLKPIAGHACRLRAIPTGSETGPELDSFAAQPVAVSEWARGLAISSGPNLNTVFNYYVNDVTFTGSATWSAAGTPIQSLPTPYKKACGGPEIAPIDRSVRRRELRDRLHRVVAERRPRSLRGPIGGSDRWSECLRSRPRRRACSPPEAPSARTSTGFPRTLGDGLDWDPATGLISSDATEPYVECDGPNEEKPTPVSRVRALSTRASSYSGTSPPATAAWWSR